MKICAIICEFNPFHNGHAYLIDSAVKNSGCDAVVCIMSGQFTQRGEVCRTDKFLRAVHAVKSGADGVVELPAPFAVAPAEIFARGGVKLAESMDAEITLAFGCESGDEKSFRSAADILTEENEEFKKVLAERTDSGESYIKSYQRAFEECGGEHGLLSSPNNILAVEYAKAIVRSGKGTRIMPIRRSDAAGADNCCPAHRIRERADDEEFVKKYMPDYCFADFRESVDCTQRFERLAADMLFACDRENLKRVYGCTEGLENRLKALCVGNDYDGIVKGACTKRYTEARIKRILAGNLLGLYSDEVNTFFDCRLPMNVLCVRKSRSDFLLPRLYTGRPEGGAARCAELNARAYEVWQHVCGKKSFNPNQKTLFFEN